MLVVLVGVVGGLVVQATIAIYGIRTFTKFLEGLLERHQAERSQLLTRIQAPEAAVALELPKRDGPSSIAPDDDDAWHRYQERLNAA